MIRMSCEQQNPFGYVYLIFLIIPIMLVGGYFNKKGEVIPLKILQYSSLTVLQYPYFFFFFKL